MSSFPLIGRKQNSFGRISSAEFVDQPIVYCGLSMGGYISLAFWQAYAARLRGLILCDTRAVADTPEVVAARRETAVPSFQCTLC